MSIVTAPTIVLILCLSQPATEPDPNSGYTGHESRDWVYAGGKMQCRREVIQVEDSATLAATPGSPADPQPFNTQRCMASAIKLATDWDVAHKDSTKYRVWRVACPAPAIDTQTGKMVGWSIPDDCGHRDTVICENETTI